MTSRYAIEFSSEAERDFQLILDHLFESYRSFGGQDHIRHMLVRLLR